MNLFALEVGSTSTSSVDKCASVRALLPLIKIYDHHSVKHFSHPSDAYCISGGCCISTSPPFIRGDCWISRHQLALRYACTWLRYYFRKWEFLRYTLFEAFDFVIYRLDDLKFCLPAERVCIRGTFQHNLMIFLYAINVWERKTNLRFKNRIYMETIRRNF